MRLRSLTLALLLSGTVSTAAHAAPPAVVSPMEAGRLLGDPNTLAALSTTPDAMDARVLHRLADRHAAAANRAEEPLTLLGEDVLGDLDGVSSAYVATYGRGQLEAPSARLGRLGTQTTRLVSALGGDDPDLTLVSGLRAPAQYRSVIMGATRAQKRLISASDGLSPRAYEALARHLVAGAQRVQASRLSARAFIESDLSPALAFGVRVTGLGRDFVYILPGAGLPTGRVVSTAAYREERDAVLRVHGAALAETLGEAAPQTPAAYRVLAARAQGVKWDALLEEVRAGATTGPAMRFSPLEADPHFLGGLLTPDHFVSLGAPECTCTQTFIDGSTAPIDTCDDFGDACCPWVDGEFQDDGQCPSTCVCECEDEVHVEGSTDYGVFIRGVPTLYQHQVSVPWSLVCQNEVAVGCGPIAVTALLSWYEGMGHGNLSDGFRSPAGEIKWQAMSETLRNDYLGSHCFGDATWTLPWDLEGGAIDFVDDQGVAYDHIEMTNYLDAGEDDAFDLVQAEIDASRPLILGYDSNLTNGLGGSIDHYGIITGYVDDTIYVNTGWGLGGNESYEFDIGPGLPIYLLTFDFADLAGFGGDDAVCAADGLSAMFTLVDGLSWSCAEDMYDDYPVLEDIGGELCDQIGGVEDYSYDYVDVSTTTYRCLTPALKRALDDSIAETLDELEGRSEPLTPLDPLP